MSPPPSASPTCFATALDRSTTWPRQPGRPRRPSTGCSVPSPASESLPTSTVGSDKRRSFRELYGVTAWDWRAAHPEENAIFNAAMTGLSAGMVESIVAAYDFSQIRSIVDVGGGEGALLTAILAANPDMRGIVFDLPHVLPGASDVLQRAGVTDRCELVAGSFFE